MGSLSPYGEETAAMIEIEHVTKRFQDNTVLDDVNMDLVPGHIYGFSGRNGSGKTMLLKIMLGFVRPTSGHVRIYGKDVGMEAGVLDKVGAIIEAPGFLPEYSAFRNLKLLAMVRGRAGREEIRDSLRLVGLDPDSRKPVRKYSMGMCQRLGLAQALMENPDILLLDEPLNSLDQEGVRDMYRILLEQKKQGKLLVIASHYKEDLENLCDRIFYFDSGKVRDGITPGHFPAR